MPFTFEKINKDISDAVAKLFEDDKFTHQYIQWSFLWYKFIHYISNT